MKTRGRKPTTGRYRTRKELEEMVKWYYYKSPNSMAEIARIVRVSPGTVARIIG